MLRVVINHGKVVVTTIALSLLLTARNGVQATSRIIGGTPAILGEFPSYAFSDFLCGGTLIHPDIVMTAAHCQPYSFSTLVGIGGIDFSGATSEIFEAVTSIPHPNYFINQSTIINDIMLVKLNGTSSAPLQKLNRRQNIAAGRPVTVIGYGVTTYKGNISDNLLQVQIKVFSDAECKKVFGSNYYPKLQICAGTEAGGQLSCLGDGGGPLMINTNGSQVGIVSWGSNHSCAEPGIPDVYTRVSAYQSWIFQTICTLSSVPPVGCSNVTPPSDNIIQVATANNLTTFVLLVELANLTSTLSTGNFTVFAPTNEAFDRLDPKLVSFLVDPANKDVLTKVLLYHVIDGIYPTSRLLKFKTLPTVEGAKVIIGGNIQKVRINGIPIVKPNITASNGIIQVLFDVLQLPATPTVPSPPVTSSPVRSVRRPIRRPRVNRPNFLK